MEWPENVNWEIFDLTLDQQRKRTAKAAVPLGNAQGPKTSRHADSLIAVSSRSEEEEEEEKDTTEKNNSKTKVFNF